MADETSSGNMKGHVATYASVIGLMKWGGVACFFIALGIIWLISRH